MLRFLFAIIILPLNISATEKTISCGFGECRPNFPSSIYLEKESMSFIDAGDYNNSNIEIILPQNQEPRALFFSVNNNSSVGKDLMIDLQSKMQGKDSKNFVLVGDIFKDVQLNIDGYQGVHGKSASDICAERFLSGQYGEIYKTQYLSRRDGDPSIPMNKCVADDVELLQRTAFKCIDYTNDSLFEEEEFSLVNVSRVKYKQKCSGTSNKYKCVKRRVRATCQWESLPLGYTATGYPCTNKWGGSNCQYNQATSCWNGTDKQQANGGGSSFPAAGNTNPWELFLSEDPANPRCSYPNGATPSPKPYSSNGGVLSGGAVAYNETTQMLEKNFRDYERQGRLEELCQTFSSGPKGPGWRFVGVSSMSYEQPGLDQDTLEPLPGSTWEVKETGFFESCSQFGDFEVLTPILEFWISYGEIGNECSDVSIAEDPNRIIPWTTSGIEQDRTFGTELVLCSPDNCPVETITKRLSASLDIIQPTAGTSGTSQGDAVLFVYDVQNLQATSSPGLGGAGGNNDLPQYNDSKYCVKKMDAYSQGINSAYAMSPVVYFNNYDWDALNVGSGQPNGADAPRSNKGLKLYKKIDSSVRYLLKNDNF